MCCGGRYQYVFNSPWPMRTRVQSVPWLLTCLAVAVVSTPADAEPPLRFVKLKLTDRYYCDGVTAADINRDGQMDVVAGPFWYAGPDFTTAHEFYPAEAFPTEPSPTNSMYTFVHDFSGDGWPDILVLGRVRLHEAYWYENPGSTVSAKTPAHWTKHFAFERVRGESPLLVDLDGDGRPQVICHWEDRWGWIEPDPARPREPWKFHPLGTPGDSGRKRKAGEEEWRDFYHGQGVGDVNRDGRLDLILNDGWYEQPALTAASPPDEPRKAWRFHAGLFSEDRGGAQMFVDDVDDDGDADVITALNAHGYGLAWFEQLGSDEAGGGPGEDDAILMVGERRFRRHLLMGDRSFEAQAGVCFSQPHALEYADLDGDGRRDIVVGKRMWAHGPKGDVEPEAAPVVYWFQHHRAADGRVTFIPHLIDDKSGVGVQITVADVNGDQRPDVLTASKLGVFVFLNRPVGPDR